ncbi:TIGR01244 family sulfur transferase [Marinomonas transparens]|uniref:TIGR01244 family phosphatase n=1 Tax=Marinomonas transparens TaxID=2795388 RepID=A0A934JUK8_9GAMM|nr:TIGR01244 family sulfur transferase [Marinomonas transparens]MBJ7537574.1 TIGR01244 family phosphatase [Marinomonas transparens]
MNDPVQLDALYFVAPQLVEQDLVTLKKMGFERVINNRPDHEVDDQPLGSDLQKAADLLGMEYISNPIDLAHLSQSHVGLQGESLSVDKKTIAFCRTGTRSSVLWVLLNNAKGKDYKELVSFVSAKGFDLLRCASAMDPLSR